MRAKKVPMSQIVLYPLRFEPIYQYRLWGGRRLAELLPHPFQATALSAKRGYSVTAMTMPVALPMDPFKGRTITQLLEQSREQLLGKLGRRFRRFPLLLKFLDAHEMLSVQVHPADSQTSLLPAGETGKTEAWVVLEAGTEKPHLRGPEARYHCRRSSTGDRERVGGGRSRILHSEARRWRFPTRRYGSRSGRRRRGIRGPGEQRRNVSSVRLGPC